MYVRMENNGTQIFFKYLSADTHDSGRMNEEISHEVKEMEQLRGILRTAHRNKLISVEAVKEMYETIIVATALYGTEARVLNVEKCES